MQKEKLKNYNKEIKQIINLISGIKDMHSVTDREGEFLYNTAKRCKENSIIVEIGSWKGVSTIWLGKGSKKDESKKIYAIDHMSVLQSIEKCMAKLTL